MHQLVEVVGHRSMFFGIETYRVNSKQKQLTQRILQDKIFSYHANNFSQFRNRKHPIFGLVDTSDLRSFVEIFLSTNSSSTVIQPLSSPCYLES